MMEGIIWATWNTLWYFQGLEVELESNITPRLGELELQTPVNVINRKAKAPHRGPYLEDG